MEKNLTPTDRDILIRVAASLPKGDERRRVLLAELQKQSHSPDLTRIVRAWLPDFKKVLDKVPDDVRSLAGSADPDDAFDNLLMMLQFGKGPRREVVEKNPRLADKLESVESDMWFEEISDSWDLDDLGVDEDDLRGDLQIQLSKELVKARLVGKNFRKRAKQARGWDGTLEGPKVRVNWSTNTTFPYMEVQELPGKPFKRKLRKAEIRWSNHGMQWPLLMENVLDDARLSRNMDYDKVVRAMKQALKKVPGKFDEKTVARIGPLKDYVKKELDRQPYESQVFYLNVEPVNYKPINFAGKGFHGESKWTEFEFYADADRDDYMAYNEGMRAFSKSTSARGARKLFKMLKANPDLIRNMSSKDFEEMLRKNKIGYRYVPTVWR